MFNFCFSMGKVLRRFVMILQKYANHRCLLYFNVVHRTREQNIHFCLSLSFSICVYLPVCVRLIFYLSVSLSLSPLDSCSLPFCVSLSFCVRLIFSICVYLSLLDIYSLSFCLSSFLVPSNKLILSLICCSQKSN
jgi:hypothetical protein